MPCYHPLKGFPVGLTANDKVKYRITSFNTHHVEIRSDGSSVDCPSDFVSPYSRKVVTDYVEIPCGRCIGCRLQYSRQWADRCMMELSYHKSSYFVTLTYDPEHLPTSEFIDEETALVSEIGTLEKRDFQLFMKKLRNHLPDQKLRYFVAGEYGSNGRPHYHAIIFGLELDDLVLYKKNAQGDKLFTSKLLTDLWSRGIVVLGDVTWESCAYTARYIMKKQFGKGAEIYKKFNIEPEFTLMSRKPGIAKQFYLDNSVYDSDFITMSTPNGGIKFKPPRYFDKLYEIDYPEESAERKANNRKFSEDYNSLKLERTSLSYLEMLEAEESVKEHSLKSLGRSL